MKPLYALFSLLLLAGSLSAQRGDSLQIQSTIERFFDGMRQQDTAMMASTLMPQAQMQSVAVVNGETRLVTGDVAKFLANVAAPSPQPWDERIWSYDIRVDGRMASVWTEYTFFYGERLLHCGVNQFMMLHDGTDWKIFYIVDTRRKADCRAE